MAVLDDPEEALHLVEAVETGEFSPPRLVVLDLNLPKFGGLELLQFMRERERWKPVPIVIMSTSSAQRDLIEAQRLGATRYLQKPIDMTGLALVGEELQALLEDPNPAVLPESIQSGSPHSDNGRSIALTSDGGKEVALLGTPDGGNHYEVATFGAFCDECRSLRTEFLHAVHEVIELNERHMKAVLDNETEPHRFDILIHLANDRKQNIKYAYVHHLETHGHSSTTE